MPAWRYHLLGFAIIILLGVSAALAYATRLLTEKLLGLFALAPGHRAYALARSVAFAVLFIALVALTVGTVAALVAA